MSIDDIGSRGERAQPAGGVVLPFAPRSRFRPLERNDPAPRPFPLVQRETAAREKLGELEQELRNLRHECALALADLAGAVPDRQTNAIRVIAQRLAFGFGGLLRQTEALADLRPGPGDRPD